MNNARITSFSIGRLHNLGNYEHIRYEVTVAVPTDASASQAMAHVEDVLKRIAPVKRDSYSCQHHQHIIANPLKYSAEEITTSQAYLDEVQSREVARTDALKEFDAIGGIKTYTDAKEQWDEET